MLPLESVTCGVGPVITELPVCERFTSLPGVAFPFASLRVTVIVVDVMPSLTTLSGDALMLAEAAGGVTNAIVGGILGVSWMLSVVSVAVKVRVSTVVSVILKTTAPFVVLVTPLGGVMIAVPLGLAVNVTVFPPTELPSLSRRITTIVFCVEPSAGKPAGGGGVSVLPKSTSEMDGSTAPTLWCP